MKRNEFVALAKEHFYTKYDYYSVEWRVGGLTGGSCWGDDANQPVDADPEPDMEYLDSFLEKIAPNITFLQYKKLLRETVTYDTYSDNDYYGNYSNYSVKKITFDALYDSLVAGGFL